MFYQSKQKRMKKLLFLAALSSVALASCVSDESPSIDATPSGKAISFNAPVMYSQTKTVAGEIGTAYDKNEEFCVFAVWTPNTYTTWNDAANTPKWYMGTDTEGVRVKYNGSLSDGDDSNGKGAWEPSIPYYWPKNGYLTFAAYSPADANTTSISYSSTGLTITGFQVNGDASKQYDLMFSERTYSRTNNEDQAGTDYDGVDIKFKHALSSIKFKVKLKEDYGSDTEIELTEIKVDKVLSKGDFNETIADGASYSAAPAWSNHADEISTAYIAYPKTTGTTQQVKYNGGTAQELKEGPNQTSNDLILLPQTLENDAIITVNYTIKSKDSAKIPQSKTVIINTLTPKWEIGTRYTYTIIFALDKIYFAPSVENWIDDSSEIDI